MQIVQFELLNDIEKEEAIWNNGIFLANYDEGNTICDVYQLFDFYVGFCYALNRNNEATITSHNFADELPLLGKINRLN